MNLQRAGRVWGWLADPVVVSNPLIHTHTCDNLHNIAVPPSIRPAAVRPGPAPVRRLLAAALPLNGTRKSSSANMCSNHLSIEPPDLAANTHDPPT